MHSTPICRNSSMKTYLVLFLLFFNGVEAAVDGLNCRNCGEIIEKNLGKYPWEAKIKVSEPSYASRMCRGILVGSRHLLSVGTCLCDLLGLCHDDPAVGGHVFVEDNKRNTLRASHLAFHPDYRISTSQDVALVGIDKFEEFGGEFSPICLPDQSENFQDFQQSCHSSSVGNAAWSVDDDGRRRAVLRGLCSTSSYLNIGGVLPWMSDHLEADEKTCQTKEGRFRRRRRRADDSPSLRLEFSGGEDEMRRSRGLAIKITKLGEVEEVVELSRVFPVPKLKRFRPAPSLHSHAHPRFPAQRMSSSSIHDGHYVGRNGSAAAAVTNSLRRGFFSAAFLSPQQQCAVFRVKAGETVPLHCGREFERRYLTNCEKSDSRELKLRLKLIFDRSSYNHFVHVYSLSKWMKIVLSHMQVYFAHDNISPKVFPAVEAVSISPKKNCQRLADVAEAMKNAHDIVSKSPNNSKEKGPLFAVCVHFGKNTMRKDKISSRKCGRVNYGLATLAVDDPPPCAAMKLARVLGLMVGMKVGELRPCSPLQEDNIHPMEAFTWKNCSQVPKCLKKFKRKCSHKKPCGPLEDPCESDEQCRLGLVCGAPGSCGLRRLGGSRCCRYKSSTFLTFHPVHRESEVDVMVRREHRDLENVTLKRIRSVFQHRHAQGLCHFASDPEDGNLLEMTMTGCSRGGGSRPDDRMEMTIHRTRRSIDLSHRFYVLSNGEVAAYSTHGEGFAIDGGRNRNKTHHHNVSASIWREYQPDDYDLGGGDSYPEKNFTEEEEQDLAEKLAPCDLTLREDCWWTCASNHRLGTCLNKKGQPVRMFCRVRLGLRLRAEVEVKYDADLVQYTRGSHREAVRFVTDVFFHMAGLYNDQSFRKFVDYKIKLRGYEYFKESLGTDERQRNYDKISLEAERYLGKSKDQPRGSVFVFFSKETNKSDSTFGLARRGQICSYGDNFATIDAYARSIEDEEGEVLPQVAVTAFVAAHEMGHMLNMEHNCDDKCVAGLVMDWQVLGSLKGIWKLRNIIQLQQLIRFSGGPKDFCLTVQGSIRKGGGRSKLRNLYAREKLAPLPGRVPQECGKSNYVMKSKLFLLCAPAINLRV